ncbi:MAG TPA: hypothetical protein VFT64_09915 [Rickettsiales bacterium]|nr:hypothetical protein [Rickettsiales bacterium]
MAELPEKNANPPTQGDTMDLAALVKKHGSAIDHLIESQDRQKEYFKDHGIDPDTLMKEHYSDLVNRSDALVEQNNQIYKKAGQIGTAATAAAVVGMSLVPKKHFSDKSAVKTAAVAFTGFVVGTLSYMGAMASLTRNIRISEVRSAFSERTKHPPHRASEKLGMESREALKRELAVLLENDERNGITYDEYLASKEIKNAEQAGVHTPSSKFASKVGQSDRKMPPAPASHVEQVKAQDSSPVAVR